MGQKTEICLLKDTKHCGGKGENAGTSIFAFPNTVFKSNTAKIMISFLNRVEKILGKGENAGYQHFLLFPKCDQGFFLSGSLKVGIMWKT